MTHKCECIEKSIRKLLDSNGYDFCIVDGKLVFLSAQVIDAGLENPAEAVRILMGGRDERASE